MSRTIAIAALAALCQIWAFQSVETVGPRVQARGASGPDLASARRSAIQRGIESIEAEAAKAAGGDWNRWFDSLAPFRAEMRAKIDAGRARGGTFLLEAAGPLPLFDDPNDLVYLWEDGDLETWLKRRTALDGVTQASRWIEQHKVDVIFVPVPKMPEVYPDRVAENVPADRIVAPQVRRLLLELLRANVEVVDLLPVFQAAREQSPEPLFLSDDSHWAPRAQALAAKAIAERLARYPAVRTARAQPARFREKPVAPTFANGCWRPFLTPEQLAKVRDHAWSGAQIVDLQDQPISIVDRSRVMLIGDSYVTMAINPGMSLEALLARQINLPVSRRVASGGTVDAIKDFAREPELLQNVDVIVWVAYGGSVSGAASRWTLPRLPAPANAPAVD